ncbi:MAG TPA: YggU family protein [Sedimenticola thiotaurini]|uniref:UPF0235 protein ENI96_13315 n=1 Tax=Sedimenticola thiotaurini TaxID=1543721 RepID=A0A831RQM3_9GAMM|nr:YggU family protein [Sedimenticola thiotaurini]
MSGTDDSWYRWEGDDLLLSLRVQPRSGRDAFVAPHGDHYKVRITAPPVEGRANAHLIRFLAREFGVRRSQVQLVTGAGSRCKGVRIQAPRKWPIRIPGREDHS